MEIESGVGKEIELKLAVHKENMSKVISESTANPSEACENLLLSKLLKLTSALTSLWQDQEEQERRRREALENEERVRVERERQRQEIENMHREDVRVVLVEQATIKVTHVTKSQEVDKE